MVHVVKSIWPLAKRFKLAALLHYEHLLLWHCKNCLKKCNCYHTVYAEILAQTSRFTKTLSIVQLPVKSEHSDSSKWSRKVIQIIKKKKKIYSKLNPEIQRLKSPPEPRQCLFSLCLKPLASAMYCGCPSLRRPLCLYSESHWVRRSHKDSKLP